MLNRIRNVYGEYPRTFWTLIGATFIDRLGGSLLFPFFALYVTERFGVGMTEVGILFSIYAISSVVGSLIGGAMTDKLGRRWMLMFGLVFSALSSLSMGIVDDLALFYLLAILVGLLSNMGGPAQQAMIADILPEEKQAEGYGVLRVAVNLTVVIGPAIGGLLASQSYLLLFVTDAVTSLITAALVYIYIPETKPEPVEGQVEQSMVQTIKGYGIISKDHLFIAFLFISILATTVYVQMNSTLSVYLRDVHGVQAQGFGLIMSLNAAIVVLFQFWVTRRVSKRPPMLMMAFGTLLYSIGFAMYGVVSTYIAFMIAMVIITIGEMVVMPVAQALVAHFSPADMRGRYMASFSFAWTISFATGPLLAGIVVDNFNPDLVWFVAGTIGLISVAGYLWLYSRKDERVRSSIEPEPVEELA